MSLLSVQKTSLDGVLIITPPTNFMDFRGNYIELYNEPLFKEAGISANFIQDDISVSKKNVLRGIHGDEGTTKLVSCLFGKFYLVVVNNNPNSSQFRQWESFELDDENRSLILIPPNFGNGHLVTSEVAIFYYKQDTVYGDYPQFTLKWNDPELKIRWPIKEPITSKRDDGREN